jgi:hypothetical protein
MIGTADEAIFLFRLSDLPVAEAIALLLSCLRLKFAPGLRIMLSTLGESIDTGAVSGLPSLFANAHQRVADCIDR